MPTLIHWSLVFFPFDSVLVDLVLKPVVFEFNSIQFDCNAFELKWYFNKIQWIAIQLNWIYE